MAASEIAYRSATADDVIADPWISGTNSGGTDVVLGYHSLPNNARVSSLLSDGTTLPECAVTEGTGQATRVVVVIDANSVHLLHSVRSWPIFATRWWFLASAAAATTADPLRDLATTIFNCLKLDELRNGFETDYQNGISIDESLRRSGPTARHGDPGLAETPAARIRRLSNLDVDDLAAIFGVSRTTYQNWMSGKGQHASHEDHLLEVLPLIEEAFDRLRTSVETRTWLISPVSPVGPKPVDLLRQRDYNAFRGALLRTRTGRETIRLLQSPSRRRRIIPPDELEERLNRLRAPSHAEDPDGDDLDP